MILSIIAVAFYALIWLNHKHGFKFKSVFKAKKGKKNKSQEKESEKKIGEGLFRGPAGDNAGAASKLNKGGRFPGIGLGTSYYDGESLASLE
jgi:hypothetical protein